MANHAPYDELAAVYALGALEGEELEQFLAHLRAGCEECERLLAGDEATLLGMASELATPPPPDVKRALFARLDAPSSTPARRRSHSSQPARRWARNCSSSSPSSAPRA